MEFIKRCCNMGTFLLFVQSIFRGGVEQLKNLQRCSFVKVLHAEAHLCVN